MPTSQKTKKKTGPGRPLRGTIKKSPTSLSLSVTEQTLLRKLGGGNVSAGVRFVLDYYKAAQRMAKK